MPLPLPDEASVGAIAGSPADICDQARRILDPDEAPADETVALASEDAEGTVIEASVEVGEETGDGPLAAEESVAGATEPQTPEPGPGIVPPAVLAMALKAHAFFPVVPVSVTLAQWAKESGWSLYVPANSNNPFGIKCYDSAKGCASAKTPEQDSKGKQRIVTQKFQAFDSLGDAFMDHARILATLRFYQGARNSSDIDGFARGLDAYATDRDYTASLIRDYLRPYDLYQYDECHAPLAW
jgi:hypothetical protein